MFALLLSPPPDLLFLPQAKAQHHGTSSVRCWSDHFLL